ncbi:MAG: VanW family protein [Candidatus Sericytochromatia bacterium]|nr:VanW family protein [Candidatus Sericytochromatia bacterium]
MTRLRFSRQDWGLVLAPVALGLLAVLAWTHQQRPFREVLTQHATSVTRLSEAQLRNVRQAARRLDGCIVGPGERLSFNAAVGPRTRDRGFVEAPAFLDGARIASVGGGVCLVASTLYAAIQPTPWRVLQRVAHPRRSLAVPPGRDATVWYGQTDLVVENAWACPVKVRARVDAVACRVELWGRAAPGQQRALRFAYFPGPRRGEQVVQVYRQDGGRSVLLSRDTYRP